MPDYCENDLIVSHPDPRMMFKFIKAVRSRHVEGMGWDGPGLLMSFAPIPHELRYAWRVDGPEQALKRLGLSRFGFETEIRRYPALDRSSDAVEHLVASHPSRWAGLTLRWALLGGPLRVTAGPRRALSWDREAAVSRWGTRSDAFPGGEYVFRGLENVEGDSRISRIARALSRRWPRWLTWAIAPVLFRGRPLEAAVYGFNTPWDPPIGFYEALRTLGFRVYAAYSVSGRIGGEVFDGENRSFELDFDEPGVRDSYRAWLRRLENPELVGGLIDFEHHYEAHLEEQAETGPSDRQEQDVFSWDWSAPGRDQREVRDCPACGTRTDHLVNLRTRDHRCLLCGWDRREAEREALRSQIGLEAP